MFTIVALLLSVSNANATGLMLKLLDCSKGDGDSFASVSLKHVQMAAPGRPGKPYYLAQIKEAKRAGLADSGEVVVSPKADSNGASSIYVNKDAKFKLQIVRTAGLNGNGRPAGILVNASFRDQTRRDFAGSLNEVWLSCK